MKGIMKTLTDLELWVDALMLVGIYLIIRVLDPSLTVFEDGSLVLTLCLPWGACAL